MGTTLNKLEYLDETKGQIKTALNQFNLGITDEDTFRSYADKINDIYDNWEKVTDEGTNITLDNTKKGKLNTTLKGDTSQYTTNGYNELNIYAVHSKGYTESVSGVTITYNDNGSVTANGKATADINYFLGSRSSLGDIFNGTYYLSGCTGGSNSTFYLSMWVDTIGTFPQTTTEVQTTKTSGKNWNIVIAIKNGTTINKTFYPMMCSTSGKSFEPYTNGASPNPTYPQNIEVVTGTQEVTISNSDNTETQTQTISLGDIELCKIGTAQDYLYKSNDKWYKKEIIYKIANKTNWVVNSIASNNRAITVLASNGYGNAVNGFSTINAICNMLVAKSQGTQASDTAINTIAVNNENIYFKLADTINTKELAKAQLDSMTSLIIYYVLATPNDIEITDETLIEQLNNLESLKSYADQTNITSSYATGNAQMIISASALKKGGN